MVAEPLELVALTRHEEVVDVDDRPQATYGVSEDTVGDLALLEPHLLHVALDYCQPGERGVTCAV